MPLPAPVLDDRSYPAILAETLARIPVHNPEWTNFNDSDPGVTLLQLFAFMTDSLLYRANLIPERNRKKFLELLGIPMQPAAAATGVVSVSNQRGAPENVTLPRGLQLQAGPVGFVTTTGLDVLPVEGRVFYRAPLMEGPERERAERLYGQLFGAAEDTDTPVALDFYRSMEMQGPLPGARIRATDLLTDTVDRSFWLALLVRESEGSGAAVRDEVARRIAGKTLTLGLAPAWDEMQKVLRPGGTRDPEAERLAFDISTGQLDGEVPRYRPLSATADGDPLHELTLVQLTLPEEGAFGVWDDLDPTEEGVGGLPPALEDDAVAGRVVAWIRIRVGEPEGGDATASGSGWAARFSWVGINAARVSQRIPVPLQRVGAGTGEPDQELALVNTPLLPDSVTLLVNGEPWTRTDDLLTAPPEVPGAGPTDPRLPTARTDTDPRVFQVDRESGVVRFGNGIVGARPPAGSALVASYAYGGGRAGNVSVGSIRTAPQLPAGFKVANPLPTWGGDDGESVEAAERRIPLQLRHRDRAVSAEDFREIVRATPGVALGRIEVLPAWHPSIGGPAPGVVTLLLVPQDPQRPEGPVPDRLFLQAVCRHLEPRRLVTTEVHLRGPDYVPLSLAVGFDAVAGVDIAGVREAIASALRTFLSPLVGGQDETGWPLDKHVEDRELWARVARVAGVTAVRGVRMFDGSGSEVATLSMSGLRLPRLDRVAVRSGEPEDLSIETTPPPAESTVRRVPVPVVPSSCQEKSWT